MPPKKRRRQESKGLRCEGGRKRQKIVQDWELDSPILNGLQERFASLSVECPQNSGDGELEASAAGNDSEIVEIMAKTGSYLDKQSFDIQDIARWKVMVVDHPSTVLARTAVGSRVVPAPRSTGSGFSFLNSPWASPLSSIVPHDSSGGDDRSAGKYEARSKFNVDEWREFLSKSALDHSFFGSTALSRRFAEIFESPPDKSSEGPADSKSPSI